MNNMLDAMIDDYANAMRRVALPERMRAGVMDAVRRERERLTSCTTSPRPAHMAAPAQTRAAAHAARRPMRPARGRRTRTGRILAAAALAAALVIGGAAASGVVPLSFPNNGSASTSAPSFILRAYAESAPIAGQDNMVLSSGLFEYMSSWSTSEAHDANGNEIPGAMDGRMVLSINLSCDAQNASSISYGIDGDDGVQLEYLPSRNGVTSGDAIVGEQRGHTVTLGGEELEAYGTADGGTLGLVMNYRLTDELLAMAEKADESNWNEYLAAHAACAVQQLDGRVLTITATSPAGQTFTQRYRIIPVEGFEEAFQANLEATLDAFDAGADPAEASNEPLFILEQLG